MPESWPTRLARWRCNWFPAYRATGARITYIAADWREVRIRLPLSRRTRNYVGTIFGGSLYGALDPIYMIMLIKAGPDYTVWDKAATIRFLRPPATVMGRLRTMRGGQLAGEPRYLHAYIRRGNHSWIVAAAGSAVPPDADRH
jgi:acyl-coenzyme A thioesterase PaaI-like protein